MLEFLRIRKSECEGKIQVNLRVGKGDSVWGNDSDLASAPNSEIREEN